jgi:hypothetical protein
MEEKVGEVVLDLLDLPVPHDRDCRGVVAVVDDAPLTLLPVACGRGYFSTEKTP